MNTQAQVELAFLCWITGDKEKYQNIITQHQDNILHYQGRGDTYTYFYLFYYLKHYGLIHKKQVFLWRNW